eukprot:TRINITY_DN11276_c0_g1_i1.p1 TRINITY_DN11276_c0_g1~~TRINITY_DN11276_c0_g1_i1.p1  ORF type:complete len:627 (+),score=130.54 TRINITY_DN11276_c0_g1_i1:238-1881(+)
MALFWLTNYSDDDVRRYSWSTISTTVSIFVSVLVFQGINTMVERATENLSHTALLAFNYVHLTFWLFFMQIAVARESGAIMESEPVDLLEEHWVYADALRANFGEKLDASLGHAPRNATAKKSVVEMFTKRGVKQEVPCEQRALELDRRKRRVQCFSTLLAHLSGFAAIHAGGSMQQLEPFCSSPLFVLIPAAVTLGFNCLVFAMTGPIRTSLEKAALAKGKKGLRAKLFHEKVSEAENDICCISLSFLIVQAVRFKISGVLPNAEGLEEPEFPHDLSCSLKLYGSGLAFACTILVWIWVGKQCRPHSASRRVADVLMQTGGGLFAWCCLWATRWMFVLTTKDMHVDCMLPSLLARCLLALVLSVLICIAVIGLDSIYDAMTQMGNPTYAKKMIQLIIEAMGILAGFSWEHAFSGGAYAVSTISDHQLVAQLALGGALFTVITPAWRKYILVKAMKLEEMNEAEGEEDEEEEGVVTETLGRIREHQGARREGGAEGECKQDHTYVLAPTSDREQVRTMVVESNSASNTESTPRPMPSFDHHQFAVPP